MSIEAPKIKIIIGEKKKEQLTAKEALKKEIRKIVAWGFITISSLGIAKVLFPEKPKKEGVSIDQIMSVYIDKDKTIKETERREILKKIEYLKEQFGDLNLWQLTYFSDIDRDVKPEDPEINGFNKLHPKLSDENLKRIWNEKYYPKGWINERVGAVEYAEQEIQATDQYGLDPKNWAITGKFNAPETKKVKITIFRPTGSLVGDDSVKEVITVLDSVLNHELGHANDWKEEDMNFKNRVEFLYDVAQQCFNKGSMESKYVESIKNDNPHVEKYCKVVEYWGEICQCYFSWPSKFKAAYPDAFALVDKYVQKEEPGFNIVEKNREKKEAIQNIIEK